MKQLVKTILFAGLLIPCAVAAQTTPDSIKLTCPLNEAFVVPPPKNAIQWDPPDLCIVLTSVPDTVVKACTSARVTNVVQNENDGNKWEVVMFCKYKDKEYYFWYTGLERVIVKKNENLKEGQTIGFIKQAGKIEMLMYDFETPVDPTKYLGCQKSSNLKAF